VEGVFGRRKTAVCGLCFSAKGTALLPRGVSDILETNPDHPYTRYFWPPGHIIGYEHTFIATLADFLNALGAGDPFHANFQDALEVQRIPRSRRRILRTAKLAHAVSRKSAHRLRARLTRLTIHAALIWIFARITRGFLFVA
jgi:hypothetical protein